MPGVPDEIANGPYVGIPDNPIADDLDNSLCEGAFDEDYDRAPRTFLDFFDVQNPSLIWGQGSHFWNPAGGPDGGILKAFNPPPSRQNAYQRAAMLYNQALAAYPSDRAQAYYLLGRVAHLLTDMATPAHTHLDTHVSDVVAGLLDGNVLAADCFEHFLAWNYTTRADLPSDPDPTGRLRLEQDIVSNPIASVIPAYLSDGGHPEMGDLYKLFYSMARHATTWDSNDVDGTGPQGVGGGSLRWHQAVGVHFNDAKSLRIWLVDKNGNAFPVEPIAMVGKARILLPPLFPPKSSRIKIEHDGMVAWVPAGQILQFGQISDFDCRRIAQDLLPQAIAHVEALYRLFWRDTHPDDPSLFAPVPGDVDADGFVTILDAFAVLNGFGLRQADAGFDARTDLDASGQIDMADVLFVITHFANTR